MAGMALHVVSFQRKEGLAEEVIVETFRDLRFTSRTA